MVFVAFDANGNPQGKPIPVLTDFLSGKKETRGRPTWVAFDKTGALLVTDDTAGIIWRVSAPGAAPGPDIDRADRRARHLRRLENRFPVGGIARGQPAWRHVHDLFEIQAYPGDEPPYDVAGWTLPALRVCMPPAPVSA